MGPEGLLPHSKEFATGTYTYAKCLKYEHSLNFMWLI
jgi:hypothetical protein